MSSSEIFALRKQGRSTEALEMARAEYAQHSNDLWFLRAYAWALYDHVKKLIDAYETKQLAPAAMSVQLTPCMREFAKMAGPLRGDSAFSQLLRLAGKASKDWQEFLDFARWAGINDFAEGDKADFVNEQGKSVDSLQKRFTRAICKKTAATVGNPQANQKSIDWGLGILEQALRDEPNDQWFNYYRCKVHLIHGDRFHDRKPALYIGRRALFPSLIRQMMKAFSASKGIRRIALLQVNDDSVALDLLCKQLKQEGISVTFSDTQSVEGKLLVTTVEKAKGLEFDACIVIGLDDIERASLNFSKNRAYVAVSRPARRLFILCEHFPPLLQKIDKQLYDRREV